MKNNIIELIVENFKNLVIKNYEGYTIIKEVFINGFEIKINIMIL